MSLQTKFLSGSEGAVFTRIGSFSTVCVEMPSQIFWLGGSERTLRTCEWFFFCMRTDMLLETGGVWGDVRTEGTLVRGPSRRHCLGSYGISSTHSHLLVMLSLST